MRLDDALTQTNVFYKQYKMGGSFVVDDILLKANAIIKVPTLESHRRAFLVLFSSIFIYKNTMVYNILTSYHYINDCRHCNL